MKEFPASSALPLRLIRAGVTAAFGVILCAGFLTSCGRRTPRCILPEDVELREGDIVFRRGNGLTSRAVLAADRHGMYSHVGMVVDSCGVKMIVHAVPGEPDHEGDPDRVKMDTPERFFSSVNADIGEVKRLRGDTLTPRRAALAALQTYRRGTLFDHDYDDSDTVKMYCCELVMHAFARAGTPLVGPARHEFRLPGLGLIRCVLPSDICNSPRLVTVKTF